MEHQLREGQAVSPHCIFLTISTAGTTPTGSSTLTITGTGGGNLTHTATVTLVVTPGSGTPAFQINSGGPAVAPFAADAFFSGGQMSSTTAAIDTSGATNPAPTAVYQTERWGGDAAFHPAPHADGPVLYQRYNLAALLFFFLFLDNLLRRMEGGHWAGFWPCSGRMDALVLFGTLSLSLVAQILFWSRIVRGLNLEQA